MSRSIDFSFYVMGVRQIMFMGIMPMCPQKTGHAAGSVGGSDFANVQQTVIGDGNHVEQPVDKISGETLVVIVHQAKVSSSL